MLTADQGKAVKLARLLEDALVTALGSPEQGRRTHAAASMRIFEVLLEGMRP